METSLRTNFWTLIASVLSVEQISRQSLCSPSRCQSSRTGRSLAGPSRSLSLTSPVPSLVIQVRLDLSPSR